jgi:RES domain
MRSRLQINLYAIRQRISGPRLCSDCFLDRGLEIEARKLGHKSRRSCRNCHSVKGANLYEGDIEELARRYFVHGTWNRTEFGGASILQFNAWHHKKPEVTFPAWLERDARLIENALGVGFFYYGPPLWRLGEIQPLQELKNPASQAAAAARLVQRFPQRQLLAGSAFFRLRLDVTRGEQSEPSQYDAPPERFGGRGRLDAPDFPVLYGSQDLEICVHECRVTKADECYLATLKTVRNLRLLDLCGEVENDGSTPFESSYLAVQFLFAAETHAYNLTRAIAVAAKNIGLDGVIYPSYFSSLRQDRIPNLALYGHPIADSAVEVVCINRLMLETAKYTVQLGPCLQSD